MADNTAITFITESRNLRALLFRVTEDQLSTGKAWEDWLESLERELRYFRITDVSDKKEPLLIGHDYENKLTTVNSMRAVMIEF